MICRQGLGVVAMSIWIPLVGRLKVKPVYAVRRSEIVLLRIGSTAVTLLRKA